jgi:hypothetical protein
VTTDSKPTPCTKEASPCKACNGRGTINVHNPHDPSERVACPDCPRTNDAESEWCAGFDAGKRVGQELAQRSDSASPDWRALADKWLGTAPGYIPEHVRVSLAAYLQEVVTAQRPEPPSPKCRACNGRGTINAHNPHDASERVECPDCPRRESAGPLWAIIAYVWDRREQYKPSSGTYEGISQIIGGLARGDHEAAWRHGELDDLKKVVERCMSRARPSSSKGEP